MEHRIKELQEKVYLTPGEQMELQMLLTKKYEEQTAKSYNTSKSGLQD